MPTQTFYNLAEEKKGRLMQAVKREFTRVPFEQVSINRIVQEAEISRGSFYQYFENKDDLFYYYVKGFVDQIHAYAITSIIKAEGNLFVAIEDLFAHIIDFCVTVDTALMENIVRQIHTSTDDRLQLQECIKDSEGTRTAFSEQVDFSLLQIESREDATAMFDILFNELQAGVVGFYIARQQPKQAKDEFRHKIKILRRGMARSMEEPQ